MEGRHAARSACEYVTARRLARYRNAHVGRKHGCVDNGRRARVARRQNDPVTGIWQAMIVVDQAGGVAMLGVPVKPGDASYGLVAERVARSLADSVGITWKNQ